MQQLQVFEQPIQIFLKFSYKSGYGIYTAINKRYSELAASDCCLSCGGAINYAKPALGEVCAQI